MLKEQRELEKKREKKRRKEEKEAAKKMSTSSATREGAAKMYFGVSLEELPPRPDGNRFPLFIEACVEFIEKNGKLCGTLSLFYCGIKYVTRQ